MTSAETVVGLIAGPLTICLAAIIKKMFPMSWGESLWRKTIVFLIVMVSCAIATTVVAAVSGSLTGVADLAEMYAIALATSQVVFRALPGHVKAPE